MFKPSLAMYLLIALVASLGLNAFLLYRAGGAAPKCEASKAVATVKADQKVKAEETQRDTALDKITVEAKADTRKEVGKVQEQTRERAEAIDRATAGPGCAAPVGLPDLDAAVDQARAAAGD